MMKSSFKKVFAGLLVLIVLLSAAIPVLAAGEEETEEESLVTIGAAEDVAAEPEAEAENNSVSVKAIAAGAVVGLAAVVGVISMAWAITKSVESISRQPEAEGSIRTALMLGLVFLETAIIYALITGILIIFVL